MNHLLSVGTQLSTLPAVAQGIAQRIVGERRCPGREKDRMKMTNHKKASNSSLYEKYLD